MRSVRKIVVPVNGELATERWRKPTGFGADFHKTVIEIKKPERRLRPVSQGL